MALLSRVHNPNFGYTFAYQLGAIPSQLGPKPSANLVALPHYTMHWELQLARTTQPL